MAAAISQSNAVLESDSSEENNIWSQLMSMASKKKALAPKNLLVLGQTSTGKSSLVSKLQGQTPVEHQKNIALGYTYMEFFSEDAEDDVIARLNLWQHEGESGEHKDLLSQSINLNNFDKCGVLITLDMLQPWNLASALQQYLDSLERHIDSLKIPNEVLEECKKKLIKSWNEYTDSMTTSSGLQKKMLSPEDHSTYLLQDGVMQKNLGLPITVVVCKSDAIENLEKDFGYKDAHFDYIQQYLRRICLKYGASLVYTSTKANINCNLLLEYIQHLLYDIEFGHAAQVVEKEKIFVPRGWDSITKIQADFENQRLSNDPNEPFENIIPFPVVLKLHEKDVNLSVEVSEDDDKFLTRLYQTAQQDSKSTPGEKTSAAFFDQLKKIGSTAGLVSPSPSSSTGGAAPSTPQFATPTLEKSVSRTLNFGAATSSPAPDEAMDFFNSILAAPTTSAPSTAPRRDPSSGSIPSKPSSTTVDSTSHSDGAKSS